MKAIIVDDERLARNELKRLLGPYEDLDITGEAANAKEALEKMEECTPDLLFLDIEMPGMDVFTMLESLDSTPLVIFTTAFSQYALQAFEYNTLDYLMKPIDPKRLEIAVDRVRKNFRTSPSTEPKEEVLDIDKQIFVRDGDRCWFVKLQDICLLESEGNYTRLYFGENKPLILRSLNNLQTRLDPMTFFRASRKHIINLTCVSNILPLSKDKLEVILCNQHHVALSRRQSHQFKSLASL